ncbi:MAG: regulatory protein RecX [Acidobacteria bacterium]|nr:MAG: regulatory protein RecX [Acidobacteriota bacterium]
MRGKTSPQKTPFEAAVAMLSRRSYSVAELRRALERKFRDSADIPDVLARLRQLGYLDDSKFAEAYASSLARVRNFGRHRVRRELKSKLVDYRVIDGAVDNAFASVSERELLERAVDKKIRTLRKPMTRARLASLCQGLIRRGFRADDIMKTIRSRPELRCDSEDMRSADLEEQERKD